MPAGAAANRRRQQVGPGSRGSAGGTREHEVVEAATCLGAGRGDAGWEEGPRGGKGEPGRAGRRAKPTLRASPRSPPRNPTRNPAGLQAHSAAARSSGSAHRPTSRAHSRGPRGTSQRRVRGRSQPARGSFLCPDWLPGWARRGGKERPGPGAGVRLRSGAAAPGSAKLQQAPPRLGAGGTDSSLEVVSRAPGRPGQCDSDFLPFCIAPAMAPSYEENRRALTGSSSPAAALRGSLERSFRDRGSLHPRLAVWSNAPRARAFLFPRGSCPAAEPLSVPPVSPAVTANTCAASLVLAANVGKNRFLPNHLR